MGSPSATSAPLAQAVDAMMHPYFAPLEIPAVLGPSKSLFEACARARFVPEEALGAGKDTTGRKRVDRRSSVAF